MLDKNYMANKNYMAKYVSQRMSLITLCNACCDGKLETSANGSGKSVGI